MKNLFLMIGIYTTIANIWRAYEFAKYKKIKPKDKDTIIAMALSVIIYIFVR